MNTNLTIVFQIIISIFSVVNIILCILFLRIYLYYCSYKSLIDDLKKETHKSNEYELLEYTDVFCRYEEGTEIGRIWGHFFLIAFNAVHLGSLVTAFISSLVAACKKKKMWFITCTYLFLFFCCYSFNWFFYRCCSVWLLKWKLLFKFFSKFYRWIK